MTLKFLLVLTGDVTDFLKILAQVFEFLGGGDIVVT